MSRALVVLRSSLFLLTQAALTVAWSVVSLLTFPFRPFTRYRIITLWSRLVVWLARVICGVRYRVLGLENLPRQPSIVLAKHQSAWETIAFEVFLPPQVWVLRRSLLRVPFFGWGLAMMSPIAIDRGAGRRALRQTLEQGRDRLAQGFWIIIFPEGTRVAPGQRGKYQVGGAWLAVRTGAPVVPIAHNAGQLWRKNAVLKFPGVITVSIGRAIDPRGLTPQELNRRVEDWIESETLRLPAPCGEGPP
ncbi:MAG TPA: lysophospholipid acyltransferase family protein [Burkholderiales bacterium]|nr:lysophospholipid acyltransferase family protein [Burkholderiales bacterium]